MASTFVRVLHAELPKIASLNLGVAVLLALIAGKSTPTTICEAIARSDRKPTRPDSVGRSLRELAERTYARVAVRGHWTAATLPDVAVTSLLRLNDATFNRRSLADGTWFPVPDAWLGRVAELDIAAALYLLGVRIELSERALDRVRDFLISDGRLRPSRYVDRLRRAGLEPADGLVAAADAAAVNAAARTAHRTGVSARCGAHSSCAAAAANHENGRDHTTDLGAAARQVWAQADDESGRSDTTDLGATPYRRDPETEIERSSLRPSAPDGTRARPAESREPTSRWNPGAGPPQGGPTPAGPLWNAEEALQVNSRVQEMRRMLAAHGARTSLDRAHGVLRPGETARSPWVDNDRARGAAAVHQAPATAVDERAALASPEFQASAAAIAPNERLDDDASRSLSGEQTNPREGGGETVPRPDGPACGAFAPAGTHDPQTAPSGRFLGTPQQRKVS